MIIIAEQKNIRQAPRKVRLVANQVKKMTLEQAISQLAVMERKSSLVILKVIKQALANAVNNHKLAAPDLQLQDIVVSDGMILRRMRAVARGRGHSIDKRTCHVRVILTTKEEQSAQTEAAPEVKPAADEKGKN